MPKGVEHLTVLSLGKKNTRVESLMPKGVEHYLADSVFHAAPVCRISDAERR